MTASLQLIKQCKKGAKKAQKELYEKYAPKMYRICFRYLRNEFDTEEVLINGFLKVFNNLDKLEYRDDRSFEAWIKRIMVNEALMFLRKNNNFNLVSIENSHSNTVASFEKPDDQLKAEDIYAIVLELPTGYRTVFNLYAIEGYSHKEIADQLNISVNTSKSQLSKARTMLKKLLKEKGI